EVFMKMTIPCLILGMTAALSSTSLIASVEEVDSIQNKTNQQAAKSQTVIDDQAERSIELQSEIDRLTQEINNLTVYESHLNQLVLNQEAEKDAIDVQLHDVKETKQGLIPLMYQMLNALEVHIVSDRPIKSDSREKRLNSLQTMMTQANVSDAEKYRRILEAYQIEMDYGLKVGLFEQTIETNEGHVTAEVLNLGRIALIARNQNGSEYWAWNQSKTQWDAVDIAQKDHVDHAFDVANKDVIPSVLILPVSVDKEKGGN
ncbi:DUF3450 domain-containing protein, partial [Vibrio sp.]|nr:DUF3450 domain-containing protein [Vibrio sp.]